MGLYIFSRRSTGLPTTVWQGGKKSSVGSLAIVSAVISIVFTAHMVASDQVLLYPLAT